jgi:hypothetical protein
MLAHAGLDEQVARKAPTGTGGTGSILEETGTWIRDRKVLGKAEQRFVNK